MFMILFENDVKSISIAIFFKFFQKFVSNRPLNIWCNPLEEKKYSQFLSTRKSTIQPIRHYFLQSPIFLILLATAFKNCKKNDILLFNKKNPCPHFSPFQLFFCTCITILLFKLEIEVKISGQINKIKQKKEQRETIKLFREFVHNHEPELRHNPF